MNEHYVYKNTYKYKKYVNTTYYVKGFIISALKLKM